MNEIKKHRKFFCEIPSKKKLQKSIIIRFKDGKWHKVKNVPYKDELGNWTGIERFPLINSKSIKFEVRYFEIAPGGYSCFEHHKHAHVVICLKGKGKIKLGNKYKILRYLDIAFIASNEIHQLLNPFKEPFGFLCIVDTKRDKPVEVEG